MDPRGVDRSAGESTHRSAVVARSPVVYLAAVVGLSMLVRVAIGLATPSPWILPDELLYTELARAIADGGLPAVRGDATLGWGVVYPLLIAPAWALFSDPVAAYHASLVVNAVVMSLAAVPAYLLARLFVPATPSLLVAAGSVLLPSMALTATVMTENAAYPLSLLAVWLMARTVRRPTLGGQALVIGAVALGAAARVSGAVLLPAFVAAAGIYALTSPPGERIAYLRRFTPTAVVVAAAVALPLLADLLDGGGAGWFGQRSGTLQYLDAGPFLRLLLVPDRRPDPLRRSAAGPGCRGDGGDRPVASRGRAGAALRGGRAAERAGGARLGGRGLVDLRDRRLDRAQRALRLLGRAAAPAGARALDPRGVAAAALGAAARGRRGATAGACCPGTRSRSTRASTHSRWLRGWRCPSGGSARGSSSRGVRAAGGFLWLRWRRGRAGFMWVITLTCSCYSASPPSARTSSHAQTAHDAYGETRRDWVDAAVPAGATVTVLWDQRRAPVDAKGRALDGGLSGLYYRLMLTELFNPSIETLHRLGGPTIYENHLPSIPVRRGAGGVVVGRMAGRWRRVVLAACNLGVGDGAWLNPRTERLVLWRTQRGIVAGASAPCPG